MMWTRSASRSALYRRTSGFLDLDPVRTDAGEGTQLELRALATRLLELTSLTSIGPGFDKDRLPPGPFASYPMSRQRRSENRPYRSP